MASILYRKGRAGGTLQSHPRMQDQNERNCDYRMETAAIPRGRTWAALANGMTANVSLSLPS